MQKICNKTRLKKIYKLKWKNHICRNIRVKKSVVLLRFNTRVWLYLVQICEGSDDRQTEERA